MSPTSTSGKLAAGTMTSKLHEMPTTSPTEAARSAARPATQTVHRLRSRFTSGKKESDVSVSIHLCFMGAA